MKQFWEDLIVIGQIYLFCLIYLLAICYMFIAIANYHVKTVPIRTDLEARL